MRIRGFLLGDWSLAGRPGRQGLDEFGGRIKNAERRLLACKTFDVFGKMLERTSFAKIVLTFGDNGPDD